MDFSRLRRTEAVGVLAGAILALSVLFFPWYSLDTNPERRPTGGSSEGFVCGSGQFSCTGYETFPIMRWLLLAAAVAPLILAWIVVRGHKLTWPPGELTMVVGFLALVLIGYNGLLDKPGDGIAEIGVSLDWGYVVALLSAAAIAVAGFLRSQGEGGRAKRKAPGTV